MRTLMPRTHDNGRRPVPSRVVVVVSSWWRGAAVGRRSCRRRRGVFVTTPPREFAQGQWRTSPQN